MGLKKISEKIGFTQLEIKVLLFLLVVFISGFVIKSFFSEENKKPVNFDYSREDSLFLSIDLAEDSIKDHHAEKINETDYKNEVLGLQKPVLNSGKSDNLPAEKSININKADIKSFSRLPGIGPKTAERIIEYRKTNSGFKKLEDLLNVKGIGNSKFNKIKKYLYIEQ